jgi:hypothetical protein
MNARVLTLLTGLIWLGAATAATPPDPSVIEHAIETWSTVTSIPTATGALAARSCTECPTRYLTLTSETKFYVGRTAVPFAEFKAIAGGTRGHSMTIFYRAIDNSTVTRIVISAD